MTTLLMLAVFVLALGQSSARMGGVGFIGHVDGSLAAGIAIMIAANGGLLWLCHTMFKRGYKPRA